MNSDSFHWGIRQTEEDGETVHLRNLGPQRSYGTCSFGDMSSYSSSLYSNRSSSFGRLPRECVTHTVSNNETLAGIALKYDISIEDIRRANSLWTNDNVWLGQCLKIPVNTKSPTSDMISSSKSHSQIDSGNSSSDLKTSQSFSVEKTTSDESRQATSKSRRSSKASSNQLIC